MQDADLFAKHPPDNEQRFDQNGQVGQVLDKLLNARLELARRSFSMAMAFDCSSLRWVSSMRSF
jgi:hypothetical protein